MEQPADDDGRRDDVAQVVLRSLLAWPLVGLTAALAVGGLQRSSGLSDALRLAAFGGGAGLGGGVVFAAADLVARARWRRWPLAILALGLLFSLAPTVLLGAEFATRLAQEGSSAKATRELVAAHSARPGALFDLDAALAVLLVAGPLLVSRARPAQAQATIAAWVILLGVAVRLATGRLEALPLVVVATGELAAATFAPFALLGADRIVTALRRAVTGPSDVAGAAIAELRRAITLLTLLLVPPAAALAWCASPRRGLERLSPYLVPLLIGLALVVVLWLARRRLARAGPLVGAAAVGGAFPVLIFGPADGGPIAVAVIATALVVHSIVLTVDATGIRAVLAQARPTSMRPVVTALLVVAAVLGLALTPRRTGLFVRAQLELLLGSEPIEVLRRVEARGFRAASEDPWLKALRSTGAHVERSESARDLSQLRLRAAAAGDAAAAASAIQNGYVPAHEALAWLRRDSAAGHPEALGLLLVMTPDQEERARLGRRLVEAAQRGQGTGASLLEVWERCPEHRVEVERLLTAEPERWTRDVGAYDETPRPFCDAFARASRQAVARTGFLAEPWDDPAFQRLYRHLRERPEQVRVGDALLCARMELTVPRARLDPLAAVAVGPLSPAPWDTSEPLATTWSRTDEVLRAAPHDPSALRARAHALMLEVRIGIYEAFGPWGGDRMSSEAGLELALGQLEAVDPAARLDAGWTFDLALVEAHRALLQSGWLDGARVHALLDAVLCLASADAVVNGQVASLRGVLLGQLGPPAPERLLAERASYAATLRALRHEHDIPEPDEAARFEARAEGAAAALEAMR